jgi:hypothetical protein
LPTYPYQLKLGKTYTPDDGVPERTASALAAIWTLLTAPGLTLAHRRHLVGIAIWKYTEAPGVRPHPKYRLPFRTLGAMDESIRDDMVQHEHVWPRKWLIDHLLAKHAAGWDSDSLSAFMREYGVACTVLKSEHLMMNAVAGALGWDRYAKVGIQVWDAANQRPLDLGEAPRDESEEPAVTDVRRFVSTHGHGYGVVSEVILAALAANEKTVTPYIRRFLEKAQPENIDLIPKTNRDGEPTTYIRLYPEIDEPTPVAVYVNYNGNIDFHAKPAQLGELLEMDGVQPWKGSYVRLVLDRADPGRHCSGAAHCNARSGPRELTRRLPLGR